MALNRVILSPPYYPLDTIGKPIALGFIFIGEVDKNPIDFPQDISIQQENGDIIQIAQPIRTNAGGLPTYNGSTVTILTDGNYSQLVQDSNENQVYFTPRVPGEVGEPITDHELLDNRQMVSTGTSTYHVSEDESGASSVANSPSLLNAFATLLDFLTPRAYKSEGSSEPIFSNGTVTGTKVFDYENGNAQSLTFTAVDCDLDWTNLPASGTLGSVWFETTTGATLPSTRGGTSSPDWQIELLSLLAINSTQTFEIWVRDGATIRINEFEYSGQ